MAARPQAGGYGGGQPDFNQAISPICTTRWSTDHAHHRQAQPARATARLSHAGLHRREEDQWKLKLLSSRQDLGVDIRKKMDDQVEEIIAILEPIGIKVTHVSDKDDKAAFDKHAKE